MEMVSELELSEGIMASGLMTTLERLAAATGVLEQAVERLMGRQETAAAEAQAGIPRIVATVDAGREAHLEERVAAAEAEIAELRQTMPSAPDAVTHCRPETAGRKTLPASMVTLLAKQGVTVDSVEAGALDTALTSLSIEQRIAVKAQLMRAGLLG